ncbi:MAG: serine/threonine-protein kinase, partial [Candidatus Xenobia bacterium]
LEDRGGPLPAQDVARWLGEALQGLRVAHAAGILHRDIKPENLMLTGSGHIKIMDFGIAHWRSEPGLTREQLGTPRYMAPELFDNQPMAAAIDIYSLGAVAWELLTGRRLWDDATDVWELLGRVLRQDLDHVCDLNPQVPRSLGEVVMRMLARDPARRLPDAPAVLEALQAA